MVRRDLETELAAREIMLAGPMPPLPTLSPLYVFAVHGVQHMLIAIFINGNQVPRPRVASRNIVGGFHRVTPKYNRLVLDRDLDRDLAVRSKVGLTSPVFILMNFFETAFDYFASANSLISRYLNSGIFDKEAQVFHMYVLFHSVT